MRGTFQTQNILPMSTDTLRALARRSEALEKQIAREQSTAGQEALLKKQQRVLARILEGVKSLSGPQA